MSRRARFIFAAALLTAFSGCKSESSTGIPGEPRPAKEIYRTYCASCHGAGGHMQQGRSSLVNSTLSSREVAALVTTGSGIMPSFRERLSDEELESLVDYVIGLRGR